MIIKTKCVFIDTRWKLFLSDKSLKFRMTEFFIFKPSADIIVKKKSCL